MSSKRKTERDREGKETTETEQWVGKAKSREPRLASRVSVIWQFAAQGKRHWRGQEKLKSRARGRGGVSRGTVAALKLCLQAFAYQLISHNQQRDQCALPKYLPLQYGSVRF